MKEICTNCIWFANNYFRFGGGVSYWCLHKNLSGKRKIKSQLVYNKEKPDWCPGFKKKPEELPEGMKKIFDLEKGDIEEMVIDHREELNKIHDYIVENYSNYKKDETAEVAINIMEKQERDNDVLKEKLEKLHDYIEDNYPNHCKHEEEDIIDVVIGINDRLKTMANHLKDEREYWREKFMCLSEQYINDVAKKEKLKTQADFVAEENNIRSRFSDLYEKKFGSSKDKEEGMKKFIVYLVGEKVCVVEGEEVMFDDTANSYRIGNNEFPRENVIAIVEV